MTRAIPNYHRRSPDTHSFSGAAAYLLVLWGFIAFVSNPVVVGSLLIGTVLTTVAVQKLLRTYAGRIENDTRTLTVPGVGEIQYRVTTA